MPAHDLTLIIAAVGLGAGLLGALLLIVRPRWRRAPSVALGLFLVVSALSSLDTVLLAMGAYDRMAWLTGAFWPFTLLLGPTLYAYVRKTADTDRTPWSWGEAVRLAWPALVIAFLASPFFFLPADLKIAVYEGEAGALASGLQLLFIAAFLAVTLGYLIAAIRALPEHMRRLRQLLSNVEDQSLAWLRTVILVMLAAWVWGGVKSLIVLGEAGREWADILSHLVETGWIVAFGYFGVRQMQAETRAHPALAARPATPPDPEPEPEKYARSALEPERKAEIARRLEIAMTRDGLYRDPLLSLGTLAGRIAVSPNQVSQTLNEHLGLSFFDYVNRFRVDEAVRRIGQSDASLLTIAHDVGFNSRSTFNAAVKKHAGKPPSAFRR